jgi:E3 ubiquitin-protein ligase RFWD2
VTPGLLLAELQCPICVEVIADPFVTPCGHTFCYQCITTHLRHQSNCPSCRSYLVQEQVHPNFLLDKVGRRGQQRTHSSAHSN